MTESPIEQQLTIAGRAVTLHGGRAERLGPKGQVVAETGWLWAATVAGSHTLFLLAGAPTDDLAAVIARVTDWVALGMPDMPVPQWVEYPR